MACERRFLLSPFSPRRSRLERPERRDCELFELPMVVVRSRSKRKIYRTRGVKHMLYTQPAACWVNVVGGRWGGGTYRTLRTAMHTRAAPTRRSQGDSDAHGYGAPPSFAPVILRRVALAEAEPVITVGTDDESLRFASMAHTDHARATFSGN